MEDSHESRTTLKPKEETNDWSVRGSQSRTTLKPKEETNDWSVRGSQSRTTLKPIEETNDWSDSSSESPLEAESKNKSQMKSESLKAGTSHSPDKPIPAKPIRAKPKLENSKPGKEKQKMSLRSLASKIHK